MNKFFCRAVFLFFCLPLFLSAVEQNGGEKRWGVVTVSVANMREKPGYASEMGTQCLLGMPVRILGAERGWQNVETAEGYAVWVTSDSLVLLNKEEFNRYIESSQVIFLAHSGFCFTEPDEKSAKVSDLVAGCVLQNDGQEGNFVRVRFPDGRCGFVRQDSCADFERWKKNTRPTGENLTEKALDYLGTPYLWGGTSSKMLDCSGLTKLCFFLNGMVIPRNASQQAKAGVSVPIRGYAAMQKGDLLFFGSPATDTKPERVSHVGIYLENGDFIHESGRVKLNSLNPARPLYSASLTRRLVAVRRFLGAGADSSLVPIAEHPFYQKQP